MTTTKETKALEAAHAEALANEEAAAAELAAHRLELADTRARLAALEALEAPTPETLAEEAATRRREARQTAREVELLGALGTCRAEVARALEALTRARQRQVAAEADAETVRLLEDAAAFEQKMRRRVEVLARRVAKEGPPDFTGWWQRLPFPLADDPTEYAPARLEGKNLVGFMLGSPTLIQRLREAREG